MLFFTLGIWGLLYLCGTFTCPERWFSRSVQEESILLTDFKLWECIRPLFLKLRFRLVVFFVKICWALALFLFIFPDEVILNLFAAPRLVFIFGTLSISAV